MGIVFQKSSLLVLDAKAKRKRTTKLNKTAKRKGATKSKKPAKRKRTTRSNKTAKRKLMTRRQQTFDYLVEETRIWMYAMILPTEIIANGDADIKKNLDETIHELTAKLLGTKIDKDKVSRVSSLVAKHILIPGLTNLDSGYKVRDTPLAPYDDDNFRVLLDNKHMKAECLEQVYRKFENFQRDYPDARTWRQVREALGGYPLADASFIDRLIQVQEFNTYLELGVPYMIEPTTDEKKKLSSKARSPNSDKLDSLDFRMIELNTIMVCGTDSAPVVDPSRPGSVTIASMFRQCNVMELNAKFYTFLEHKSSLRDITIRVGRSSLRNFFPDNGLVVFLHELTHSQSVLNTYDHKFRYVEADIDVLDTNFLVRTLPTGDSTGTDIQTGQIFGAYGLEACLALIRRDERDDTNKAEDNAESWAIYFMIRMLILAYPEVDFLSALNTEDPFQPPDRILHSRKELLHHCTLFERLRDREPLPPIHQGGIRNQLGYDPSKDYWSVFSGRRDARTVKDILEILQETLDGEERKTERKKKRNKKSKAKKKAKGMLKKKKKGVDVQTGSEVDADHPSELRRMINSVFSYLEKLWKR